MAAGDASGPPRSGPGGAASHGPDAGEPERVGVQRRPTVIARVISFFDSTTKLLLAVGGLIAAAAALWAGITHFSPHPPPHPPSPLPPGQVVQDATGTISVLVPQNWNSIFGNGWHPRGVPPFPAGTDIGPGLNASTNSDAWFNDLTTPGIFVGASRLLPAHYTPSSLLQQISVPHGCASLSSQGYATAEWTGTQDMWSCAHSATRWWTIAMWPHDHNYIVYVQIKIVTSLDKRIGARALASLSVTFSQT